jgi:hypothetical protein
MVETLSETWGSRTFMDLLPRNSNHSTKKERGSAARPAATPLAAVLPEVAGEVAQRRIVGGVVVVRPLGAAGEHPSLDEALQVVAEGRGWQADVRLNVARGRAITATLNDEAEDLEADRVAECAELLGVTFERRGHVLLLTFSKHGARAGSIRERGG